MAKELPYFKFEPAEYLTKDISFCSLSAQGLFINICSYYWQRNCKITKSQLLKRLDYEDEFDELIFEGVIDLDENEYIIIKFLDNQLSTVEEKSKINSTNGSKGGRPKKNIEINPIETEIKPKLNPIESETKGIREDKIKEDNTISLSLENDFNKFWNIYNKKNDSKRCKDKFIKLPKKDIEKILEVVNDYVVLTPDAKFRKNPLTWLNGKCWNDIEKTEYCPTPDKPFGKTNQI